MSAPRDLTNLEIKRAVGGDLHWPDPNTAPLRTAALWRFTQLRLAKMFGADHALDCALLGCYSVPPMREAMSAGAAAHSAWVCAQRAAGRSEAECQP